MLRKTGLAVVSLLACSDSAFVSWSLRGNEPKRTSPWTPQIFRCSKNDSTGDDRHHMEYVSVDLNKRAFPQQTPHSGRHFLPSHPAFRNRLSWRERLQKRRKRFTEGWYYRLTIPDEGVSFAFIVSIEDPGLNPASDIRLACIQVIGPENGYIVQGDRNDGLFWASKEQQSLGCSFSYMEGVDAEAMQKKTALSRVEWSKTIESGFQILPTMAVGRVKGPDGTKGTILNNDGKKFSCEFSFNIEPICGWGGTLPSEQRSTAGWLASFPVFEPHWQVTLADARASGNVTWKGTTYTFKDAPFYAEKNWGAALPRKWYWSQCNSFDGYDELSIVAGGGIRKIPFGKEEALGMVACHYNGYLYEAVPWLGGMSWEVSAWGSWLLKGNSTMCERPFEVEVSYNCDPISNPGLVFRAPTYEEGMVRMCRDTFEADCKLSLWELTWDEDLQQYVRATGRPIIDCAKSSQGGAEIGGGPWWDTWKQESVLSRPVKALLRMPYRIQMTKRKFRSVLSSLRRK